MYTWFYLINSPPFPLTLHELSHTLYYISSIATDGLILELFEDLVRLIKVLKGAFGVNIVCWQGQDKALVQFP